MWILMLEAGVALFLLVFIVWWTMFSGRRRGELELPPAQEPAPGPPATPPPPPPPPPGGA